MSLVAAPLTTPTMVKARQSAMHVYVAILDRGVRFTSVFGNRVQRVLARSALAEAVRAAGAGINIGPRGPRPFYVQ